MLQTCLLSLVILACLHNVWALVAVLWSFRHIHRTRIGSEGSPSTHVVLLLPMYQEAAIAQTTLSYFSSLEYPRDLMRIVAITTAREKEGPGVQTTAECVKEWLERATSEGDLVLHVHTDGADGCKADQLNAALQILRSDSRLAPNPSAFIGVYDADSRPDRRVLQDVDWHSRQNPSIRAFQQGAVYFANWARLPPGLRGAYLKTRPFYNLRFWMYRELPGCARSVFASRLSSGLARAIIASPNHFLGHGEFVRVDLLESLNGFPPPSADTSLGTIISFSGWPIGSLATYDVGESPASVVSLYRQGITWYSGCCLYLHDLKRAWHLGAKASLAQLTMCIRRWLENMIWCVGPLLLTVAMAVAATLGMWIACIIGGLACVLHAGTLLVVGCGYERLRKQIRTSSELPKVMTVSTIVSLFSLYPLMLLVCCLSPLTYYCLRVRRALTGAAVPRPKTPRD